MNNIENLVPIPELSYDKNYLVNLQTGKVWSNKKMEYLNPKTNRFGYRYITTTIDGKRKAYSVHSLVYSAGMGVPIDWWKQQKLEINHKNGKDDDSFYSLELCTRKQQYEDAYDPHVRSRMGGNKRLKQDEIMEIMEQYIEFKDDEDFKFSKFIDMMAEAYDYHYRAIFNLMTGRTYKGLTGGIIG